MAEFQEVCKHWARMCKAFAGDCDKCPVEGSPCQYIAFRPDDLKYIEEPIMQWAEQNPEPVYPTWEEWLMEQGILVPDTTYANMKFWYAVNHVKIKKPIPADIAQKLGIEPKEGA